jgi:hypothetical protein
MAAGLGFKTFTTGEVLTAADTNGYLMQGINVFADATARDAAITSPQEGQFAYLKNTNVTTYYTGSAWENASSGGMTLISTTTMSGSPITLSSIPSTYKDLVVRYYNAKTTADNQNLTMTFNGNTSSIINAMGILNLDGTLSSVSSYAAANFLMSKSTTASTGVYLGSGVLEIPDYSSANNKRYQGWSLVQTNGNALNGFFINGNFASTAAISSITFTLASGTFNGGTILLYGVS